MVHFADQDVKVVGVGGLGGFHVRYGVLQVCQVIWSLWFSLRSSNGRLIGWRVHWICQMIWSPSRPSDGRSIG